MSHSTLAASIRQLRGRLAVRNRNAESDEQLLHAFAAYRDETAFVVLVHRYGPMVLHVCRRVLNHEQDAEDAFQATFLVLVRKAAALRSKTSLASFLHGTAYRMALKAKQSAARCRRRENQAPARPSVDPADELSWREVRTLLDEEIARLPEKYRSVFILCYLENLSRAEAGRRLGLKERTVLSRLAESRKRLAKRLAKRGVELTAVLAMAGLATQSASALSPMLIASTIKAALATAAGEGLAGLVSVSVAELVKSATAAMVSKAKMAMAILLTLSAVGSAGVWAYHGRLDPPLSSPPTNAKNEKERPKRVVKDDVPIRGRILNLEGMPIVGVTVRPVAVVANAANDLGRLIKAIETDTWAELPNDHRLNRVISADAAGLKQKTVTDSEGKFTLSGFGRERLVVLRLDGPTIETCLLNAMTRLGPTVRAARTRARLPFGAIRPEKPLHPPSPTYVYAHGVPFDFAAAPAVVVEGTVRDQDNGKPLAGVVIRHRIAYDFGWAQDELTTATDVAGNYRLAGLSHTSPRSYQIDVIQFVPPRDQLYFPAGISPPAPVLGKPVQLDVRLKRGILVKGRVTDQATGRPVQARVEYFAFADNPNLRGIKGFDHSPVVSSEKDGAFTLLALHGRGIVTAKTDVAVKKADRRQREYLKGQGEDAIKGIKDVRIDCFETRPYMCMPIQFNTLVGIDPDAKVESVVCDLQLDPGKTVKGTVLDPHGKPLAGVSIRGPFRSDISIPNLPSAAFTIPAVDPRKPEAYFFEHPKKNLATVIILKGDEADGFTMKLKPTATLTGRLVTEEGEPIRNGFIRVRLEAGQLNMIRD